MHKVVAGPSQHNMCAEVRNNAAIASTCKIPQYIIGAHAVCNKILRRQAHKHAMYTTLEIKRE